MHKPQDHVNQAKFNEQLVSFLEGTAYPDWRATVVFYAAVHYVQAYFSSLTPPLKFSRHKDRDTAIENDKHVSAIWNNYRSLKDWSREARYSGTKPEVKDFKEDIFPSLAAIKKHLRAFLPYIQ
ncbi:MAG: hypothetical protein ABSA33_02585 [Candidatus Micrarchaeaceae archaeon]